jgi:1-acyl-sn-glycerol-3-phosphate acyltransferase
VGFGAGLFAVPLNAFLQEEAGATEKGRILATNNFANMLGVIAASGVLYTLHDRLRWGAGGIILALGAVMLPASFYIVSRMPECVVRFILWCTANALFRIHIEGAENIPPAGAALLVSNHISYADAVLVGCLTRRKTIHFMMWKPIFDVPIANYFFRVLQAIPIDASSPKTTVRAIRAARAELEKGGFVGIFPEGSISRTGEVFSFERGFEKILQGADAPLIPIRIEGLYGHPFSCKGGAPFQSWQKLWRPRVTVRVGAPIRGSISPGELREAVVRV